jgi:hypothetical protein
MELVVGGGELHDGVRNIGQAIATSRLGAPRENLATTLVDANDGGALRCLSHSWRHRSRAPSPPLSLFLSMY